ncbi:MAG: hypothetical protein Q8N82_01260 [Deltaproteobacteria bacterium]|nr:hypothetical protein [Deltaproteobacteria bacterium]
MHSTIIIELSEEEIQCIMRIILDEDKEEALGFVKECLGKKIKQKTGPHCVPVFEASYRPGQKDRFTKK